MNRHIVQFTLTNRLAHDLGHAPKIEQRAFRTHKAAAAFALEEVLCLVETHGGRDTLWGRNAYHAACALAAPSNLPRRVDIGATREFVRLECAK